MFVYLSKKIAIPNGIHVRSISWNKEKGWIACGGEQGLLKVLRLETTPAGSQQTRDAKARGLAAPSNLTMNQALEGHNGAVVGVVAWNEPFQRLTSSDQNGLIIVWTLHDGNWIEEMLNNRGKSLVRDMDWNADGQKICIIYDDGAVIVGSVDGNRIWGKELKGMQLHKVAWSPDSKKILFGTAAGEIHTYDYHGSSIGKVSTQCLLNYSGPAILAGIRWYHPRSSRGCAISDVQRPSLAVCFQNGRVQLMQNDQDPAPIVLDAGMRLSDVSWSCDGSTLALAGGMKVSGQEKEVNVVVFYSAFGEHLRTLKVPGKDLFSISWEEYSLRVALAVDSFIYFANIRPNYKWCYFANTLGYAYSKSGRADTAVMFWNLHSGEKHLKYVKSLLALRGSGEYCLLVARADQQNKHYIAVICNSIGTPMDSNYIDLEPLFLDMTSTHVFIANKTGVYVWQYRASHTAREFTSSALTRKFDNRERAFHVDDLAPGTGVSMGVTHGKQGGDEVHGGIDFSSALIATPDSICALCASDKLLVIARESGVIQRYLLPKLSLEKKHNVSCAPHSIALNCTSSKLSIIDSYGVLSLFDFSLTGSDGSAGQQVSFEVERKDVWHLKWANDNSDLFACMEKTRMYIIRGVDPEEPVASSGYICEFSNLQVRSAHLDEIMRSPDNPQDICTSVHEVKSLRDCRELLKKVVIEDCFKFVEKNPHPRLWHHLAEQALEQLEMDMAEKAFVRCSDYQGIQFIKRLQKLDSQPKQRAEVASYFNRFDDAEKLYLEMDRKDLALELRVKLGDWFRVVQLLRTGGGAGNDTMLERAWNAIGDYFAERQKWQQAVTYYVQAQNHEKLVHCYQILENYSGLESLLATLPEGHSLLSRLGEIFLNAGMAEQCLKANLKCHNVKAAVNACVRLNQWDRAVELAKDHTFPEIDALLMKYASRLLEEKKLMEAVELYRKSNRSIEGAELLQKICVEQQSQGASPLRLKKLHVLKALLVREHQERLKGSISQQNKGASTLQTSLEGLLRQDTTMGQTNFIERAWHGAEAYHFFLLAQRQLYDQKYSDAMITAVQLQAYDDVIPPRQVYSLVALTAAMARAFSVCSKAFCKLETIPGLGEELQDQIQALAMEIFTQYSVRDERLLTHTCYSCEASIPCHCGTCPSCETKFPVSVLTGRPLMAEEGVVWFCGVCKHKAEESVEDTLQHCPMCHAPID